MFVLSSINPIKHNIEISRCWIFKPSREICSTCHKAMLLVFNRTSTNCHVRNQIIHKRKIFRIKHFISSRHTCFCDNTIMKMSNGFDSVDEARGFCRIRLVNQALIAISVGTGFGSVNTHNHKDTVCHFFLQSCQTLSVFKNSFFIVR